MTCFRSWSAHWSWCSCWYLWFKRRQEQNLSGFKQGKPTKIDFHFFVSYNQISQDPPPKTKTLWRTSDSIKRDDQFHILPKCEVKAGKFQFQHFKMFEITQTSTHPGSHGTMVLPCFCGLPKPIMMAYERILILPGFATLRCKKEKVTRIFLLFFGGWKNGDESMVESV